VSVWEPDARRSVGYFAHLESPVDPLLPLTPLTFALDRPLGAAAELRAETPIVIVANSRESIVVLDETSDGRLRISDRGALAVGATIGFYSVTQGGAALDTPEFRVDEFAVADSRFHIAYSPQAPVVAATRDAAVPSAPRPSSAARLRHRSVGARARVPPGARRRSAAPRAGRRLLRRGVHRGNRRSRPP
jgi:hypothetical protein